MALKEELIEKIKLKEADKYISALLYVERKEIVNEKDIDDWIKKCINEIVKKNAIADMALLHAISKNNLSSQSIRFFHEGKISEILFRSDKMYWKFWAKLGISDVKGFITNLVDNDTFDFYIVDAESKNIVVLSNEEDGYWIFSRNARRYE